MPSPIIIDRREVMEMVEHRHISGLEELSTRISIPLMEDTLEAGDFAFLDRSNESLGIERCSIPNLIYKLRNGDLERQLSKCTENYSTVILLLEGVYDQVSGFLAQYSKKREGDRYFRSRIEPSFRYTEIKALEVRLEELGIQVLESANFDCSISLVETIYQQRTKPEAEHTLFSKIRPIRIPVKMSANPAVPRLMGLGSRIPEKVAIQLINKYGSIWAILHTPDKELLEMEGFGKGLLASLKKGVGKDG